MVGRTRMPPLATAAVPRTTCSGETEMPWPKPTVIVAISFQVAADWMIGSAGFRQLDRRRGRTCPSP